MFIIFGTKQLVKNYGSKVYECGHCHNMSDFEYAKITKFISFFFIPMIPYSVERVMYCKICRSMKKLSKEEFESQIETVYKG